MKFIWNEPPNQGTPHSTSFPPIFWERPIIGWLNYNGVWPESGRRHWQLEYNYVYHFFDISMFECWLPYHGNPDEAIKAMRTYLQGSGLDWSEMYTWTWENKVEVPGVRFWIQAEDYPRRK